MISPSTRRGGRKPAIVIDAQHLDHLHALVYGGMIRDPDLADELLAELARAKVVTSGAMPADVADIGNLVLYRDETTGREQEVTLVFPEEADITRRRVSVFTPIGVALLGLREGARFEWRTRTGELRNLVVVRVSPVAKRGGEGAARSAAAAGIG